MASTVTKTSWETIPSTAIRILKTVDSIRSWRRPHLINNRIVSLVPTMGALHKGHLNLIRTAARETDHVVVSIYVNPTQFGAKEDLSSYPVNWESDCRVLAELNQQLAQDSTNRGRISAVFAPNSSEMFPSGLPGQDVNSKGSFVNLTPVSEILEGASRPTLFRGIATVCMKLFNIVRPDRTYFGQKDVQQTVVVKKLIRDFMLPIEVSICPTEREPDGLAMSSRNVYLGERRRRIAPVLIKALQAAAERYHSGSTDRETILGAAMEITTKDLNEQLALPPQDRAIFEVDYISLADPDTMVEETNIDPMKGAILSGAVKMLPVETPQIGEDLGFGGGPAVRLIDNIILEASGKK